MNLFEFDFDPRYQPFLRMLGVTPLTAGVEISEGRLLVRFGPWRVDTAVDNVTEVALSGGFKWYRALGPRLSLADRGLTFGTAVDRAAHIRFERPIKGFDPFGLFRHPALTVTVARPRQLAEALLLSSRDEMVKRSPARGEHERASR